MVQPWFKPWWIWLQSQVQRLGSRRHCTVVFRSWERWREGKSATCVPGFRLSAFRYAISFHPYKPVGWALWCPVYKWKHGGSREWVIVWAHTARQGPWALPHPLRGDDTPPVALPTSAFRAPSQLDGFFLSALKFMNSQRKCSLNLIPLLPQATSWNPF